MDPVRTPSSLEATGASENDVQVVIPVSDEELVAPTMAGFGTPEVPLDGSRFQAYRFPAPTCPEYAEAVAPRPVPSANNMTTAELANAMEVLSLLNQSGRLQQMVQQVEHHEDSFTNAPQTHESGTTSSSTNPFQSVPWRSNVTYATMPGPPIRGEPIVHGVPTGVPEPKLFSEPQAPKRTHVFEASPSSEESTILLSTLQQLKGRLENLENRTSANLTTNPCVPYHPSNPSVHRACRCASWSQLALCTPYQSTQTRGVLYHYLRSIHPRPSPRHRTRSTSAYGATPRPHTTGATYR